MNNAKRGITLVSALIIVVVLSVFTGATVISIDKIQENTNKKEFIREYKLVEAATKDYVMRSSGIIGFKETTFNLMNVEASFRNQFEGEEIVNNTIDMYVIDLEKIGVINSTYGVKKDGDENDIYLLSKSTDRIYYKKGFEDNNNIYYKVIYE